MSTRVLRIELKRSGALWAGAVFLASALAYLSLVDGAWSEGVTAWTAQWTTMALWTRAQLFFLWPLAIGFGALQGLRDPRSKMNELLTSTPRPVPHRAFASAGPTAVALASAFVLLILVGAVQVLPNTGYAHLGWLPISLVGAFSLVAGAVLGMGVGRALPSALTPPAAAMGAFVFTTLMQLPPGHTQTYTATGFPVEEPNQISLLSPAVDQVRNVLVTLSVPVHVGQAIWLLGMATTGFALLVAATARDRLLALAPVLVGLVTALLVLPSDPYRMYVVDKTAAQLVCDGPVCVTKVHRTRLADLVGPGKEALHLLRGSLGRQAPVSVREIATVPTAGATPRWSRETVLIDYADNTMASAKGKELTRYLIATAMVPGCSPLGLSATTVSVGDSAAQTIAVSWVLGDFKPLGDISLASSESFALARPVWQKFKTLTRAEQLSRIGAMRDAALSCRGDAFDVLKGGASR
ncbi:hypothetical protein ACFXDH_38620 [Streptomyces sp. NPDC059467]|uniref:hypothetical protein n=1 Tax=Streptomyces sp. NPDC059467 TaxID=3346844 RepID=UPI0036761B83